MTKSNLLAWIDLEMTGLDPEKHHIIEIATLVTDSNLNIVEEGPEIAIYQTCLLYTSPSPRDVEESRMPSSA